MGIGSLSYNLGGIRPVEFFTPRLLFVILGVGYISKMIVSSLEKLRKERRGIMSGLESKSFQLQQYSILYIIPLERWNELLL